MMETTVNEEGKQTGSALNDH